MEPESEPEISQIPVISVSPAEKSQRPEDMGQPESEEETCRLAVIVIFQPV